MSQFEVKSRPESYTPVSASIRSRLPESLQATFADVAIIQSLATGHGIEILQALGETYSGCEPPMFEATFKVLIDAAAADEPSWGTDERDAVLAIANQLSMNITTDPAINTDRLFNHYTTTVSSLEMGSDYFGAPHSLYEIGNVLASAAGKTTNQAKSYETRMRVRDAWSGFFPTIPDVATREVSKTLVENLVTRILPVTIMESKTFEWSRTQPVMSEQSQALHDSFLREVKATGTFKSRLYGETPLFQGELAKHKLTLANYWNLTDPRAVTDGVTTLASSQDLKTIAPRFSKSFSEKYQLSLEDLLAHPEIAGILADEIQAEMQVIRDHMILAVRQPEDMFSRLLDQTIVAKTAGKPMRKLRPVINLLESLGFPGACTPDDVEELLMGDATRSIILEKLGQQRDQTQERISRIEELFPATPYKYLTLMSRQESDLYAADDTRDCTAYHLENGFNGWSVPHWLANPGFNMAYIHDDEGKVAKIGLLLAVDEHGPRLVLDSIETSKNITTTRNSAALLAIHSGLQELQNWADNQSLGDIIFCTYTNSQELTLELPVTPPDEPPKQLAPLGSMVGLQEYWGTVPGNKGKAISLGYLQSRESIITPDEFADDFTDNAYEMGEEYQNDLRTLETMLTEAKSDTLNAAAREGDWEDVVNEYVRCQLPLLHKVFGDNSQLYTEYRESTDYLSDMIRLQNMDFIFLDDFMTGRKKLTEYNLVNNEGTAQYLDQYRASIEEAPVLSIDPFLSLVKYRVLQYQADKMTELNVIMHRLSLCVDPSRVLERIYGAQENQVANPALEVDDDADDDPVLDSVHPSEVMLRLNLPILKRDN